MPVMPTIIPALTDVFMQQEDIFADYGILATGAGGSTDQEIIVAAGVMNDLAGMFADAVHGAMPLMMVLCNNVGVIPPVPIAGPIPYAVPEPIPPGTWAPDDSLLKTMLVPGLIDAYTYGAKAGGSATPIGFANKISTAWGNAMELYMMSGAPKTKMILHLHAPLALALSGGALKGMWFPQVMAAPIFPAWPLAALYYGNTLGTCITAWPYMGSWAGSGSMTPAMPYIGSGAVTGMFV